MYPDWAVPLSLGVLFLWLGALSFLVWRQNQFLISLFPKTGERDIRKKFEEVVKSVEGFKESLSVFENKAEATRLEGLKHVQKVALMRFNPYEDTGGNISFSICLLDNLGNGIVLTSLHARSGTRVFGKQIVNGKSKKQELSKEEELVIQKAMEES